MKNKFQPLFHIFMWSTSLIAVGNLSVMFMLFFFDPSFIFMAHEPNRYISFMELVLTLVTGGYLISNFGWFMKIMEEKENW